MSEISVDLSEQSCPVFNLDKDKELILKNKNFIFGKNGSGKSTLTNLIRDQYQSEFDIRIFTGFESILTDSKLNAVVLGTENAEIKRKLDGIESDLEKLNVKLEPLESEYKSLTWMPEYEEDGIIISELLKKNNDAKKNYEQKDNEINRFYQDMARKLKQMNNPQITIPSYNKNYFISDIPKVKELNESEIMQSLETLREQAKQEVQSFKVPKTDFQRILDETNELIQYQIEETTIFEEVGNDSKKKSFADFGRKIHEPGDKCAFCGNTYAPERSIQLENYFSAPVLKEYQEKLRNHVDKLEKEFSTYKQLGLLIENNFYNSFKDKVKQCNELLKLKQKGIIEYLNLLIIEVREKQSNNFMIKASLQMDIPESFSKEIAMISKLIQENNDYSEKLDDEQTKSREALRLHHVYQCLNLKEDYLIEWQGFELESFKLKELEKIVGISSTELESKKSAILGSESNPPKGTIKDLTYQIDELELEKSNLLKKTQNTSILAENINTRLKHSGKSDLQLELQKDENEIEHYLIKDGTNGVRPIDQISTGEKNIIAFLYFMENLSVAGHTKKKIIIFDDPMNSNDDTMQYLIITEMQKLYRGNYNENFNANRDYFICLTHNAHFYLNIQPHGYFKEKKIDTKDKTKTIEVSKYTKNNFYRIMNGVFRKITSEKEDLNTHYEYLWIELESLYENNLINSMLNTMRRIVETYTKFNNVKSQAFYKDKEEQEKLFNVNSHSIDDLSAELVGKTRDQLLELFKQLFYENSAKNHYNSHCKIAILI